VVDKLLKITRDNGVPDHLREVQAKLLEEVVIVSQDYLASRKTKALVPRQQPRPLLRRLLLLYFPQSLKGWLVHVPFYMLIGVFSLLWSLTIFRMFQGEYNWPMLPNLVGLQLGFFIVILWLQRLASRIDAPKSPRVTIPVEKDA
jgi:hypothetical protein